MGRTTYNITDENRRRLDLLIAFSILDGKGPTVQDIVNRSIQDFFVRAYESYCRQSDENDMLRQAMERMLPEDVASDRCRSTIDD